VGLIKEVLLLPLAPVRGTIWIAEQLAEEAERQLDPRAARRRALLELEERLEAGEIDDEEYDRLEDELLQAWTTTMSGGSEHGGVDQEDDKAGTEPLALTVGRRLDEAHHEREHP
jgi:hypothetical protein